ncbi:MAG: aldolase [Bryobacterales bacterium]|nr:aldolase [Bryobacterales bacterium]
MSNYARIHRLFAADGRCLIVALDHGIFHEPAFLAGIEDIAQAIGMVVKSQPDALQLSPGTARILQSIPGPSKPALVMRVDTTNLFAASAQKSLYTILMERSVEQALIQDAAAVIVNLVYIPGETELHSECIRNIGIVRSECERMAMPLMIEPLVLEPSIEGAGYRSSGYSRTITVLVRQAVELGADIIKTDACDPAKEFGRIVEASGGRPLLVRGGTRKVLPELLHQVEEVLQLGARGLVFGRNVVQQKDPERVIAALMAMVHDGAPADDAIRFLESEPRKGPRKE